MINETEIGFEINLAHLKVFFGNSSASLETLKKHHPQFDFVRLKQIHSDAVVETRDLSLDYQTLADSHWSFKSNLALCIITADCVPVFFYDPKQKLIAGIHAGWRGVANQIILKTFKSLSAKGSLATDLQVFIGPHIQYSSFEVGLDVRDQILSSLGPLSPEEKKEFYRPLPTHNKFLVDLNKAVHLQLKSLGIQEKDITNFPLNTFEDARFHSHRRDKEKAGRQISFICQTS